MNMSITKKELKAMTNAQLARQIHRYEKEMLEATRRLELAQAEKESRTE